MSPLDQSHLRRAETTQTAPSTTMNAVDPTVAGAVECENRTSQMKQTVNMPPSTAKKQIFPSTGQRIFSLAEDGAESLLIIAGGMILVSAPLAWEVRLLAVLISLHHFLKIIKISSEALRILLDRRNAPMRAESSQIISAQPTSTTPEGNAR